MLTHCSCASHGQLPSAPFAGTNLGSAPNFRVARDSLRASGGGSRSLRHCCAETVIDRFRNLMYPRCSLPAFSTFGASPWHAVAANERDQSFSPLTLWSRRSQPVSIASHVHRLEVELALEVHDDDAVAALFALVIMGLSRRLRPHGSRPACLRCCSLKVCRP